MTHALLALLLLALTITQSAALEPIAEDDPIVGTWIGVGWDRKPALLDAPSGGFGSILFICYLPGQIGTCDALARDHYDSGATKSPEPWNAYVYRVSGGVYAVSFGESRPLREITMLILDPSASVATSLLFLSGERDFSGLMEFTQWTRAPENFAVSDVLGFVQGRHLTTN
jgi:hypothetical protein